MLPSHPTPPWIKTVLLSSIISCRTKEMAVQKFIFPKKASLTYVFFLEGCEKTFCWNSWIPHSRILSCACVVLFVGERHTRGEKFGVEMGEFSSLFSRTSFFLHLSHFLGILWNYLSLRHHQHTTHFFLESNWTLTWNKTEQTFPFLGLAGTLIWQVSSQFPLVEQACTTSLCTCQWMMGSSPGWTSQWTVTRCADPMVTTRKGPRATTPSQRAVAWPNWSRVNEASPTNTNTRMLLMKQLSFQNWQSNLPFKLFFLILQQTQFGWSLCRELMTLPWEKALTISLDSQHSELEPGEIESSGVWTLLCDPTIPAFFATWSVLSSIECNWLQNCVSHLIAEFT